VYFRATVFTTKNVFSKILQNKYASVESIILSSMIKKKIVNFINDFLVAVVHII